MVGEKIKERRENYIDNFFQTLTFYLKIVNREIKYIYVDKHGKSED